MRPILAFILIFFSAVSYSQDRVEWNFSYDAASSEVRIKAEIAEGWHLYSQHVNNDIGPVPTSFEFEESSFYTLQGSTREPRALKEYDENFEGELDFFKDSVTFVQRIAVNESCILKGTVVYMVCNDTMCLPPTDVPFEITIEK